MGALIQDLRYAVRTLAAKPMFTVVAALALALGIGANSAIFSVVNSTLLRPFRYPEPDRILIVRESSQQMESMSIAYPNYLDWEAQNSVFQTMALYRRDSFNLTGVDDPERLFGRMVTSSLLPLLGVQPVYGRNISEDEDRPGAEPVAILSYGLWQRRFGADPGMVGRKANIDGRDVTVIGILPANFRFFTGADLLVPLKPWAEQFKTNRGDHPGLSGLARLKPGVSLEAARADLETIAIRLEKAYPDENMGSRVFTTPLPEYFIGDFNRTAVILMVAVGFVLLIACANVANLLLARAAARSREIAIRTALGAGRRRIIRQLLTESVLLSLLGGVAGLGLAYWGVDLLVSLEPGGIPRLREIGLDGRVVAFTMLVSIGCGLLFGLMPALQASRSNVSDTLKEGSKGTMGPSRHRARSALVVAELALALVLLIGAGLMIRSFARVLAVDPGFDPNGLLTMQMSLRPDHYSEAEPSLGLYRQLLEKTATLPGVESVAIGSRLPLEGGGSETGFRVVGRPEPAPGAYPMALYNNVSLDYFKVMEIPVLQGRTFTDADRRDAPLVVVIDEALAKGLFPNENPVGQQLLRGDHEHGQILEIIGVVPHIAHYSLEGQDAVPYQFYFPYVQLPEEFARFELRGMNLLVRAKGDPMGLAPAIRAQLRSIDPGQPVYNVRSMNEMVTLALAERRFNMLSLGIFAAVAMLLAAVGIYGVMGFSVTQRTNEIGIRMALGAKRADVLRLIVGQGMKVAFVGIVIGLGMALLVGQTLQGMVFGVTPTDPVTFLGVAACLLAVAFLACYIPARRASRVDPMTSLRHQ